MTIDTELLGAADRPVGCAAIHNDLKRLEKWADRNLLQFNKGKSKVLHWRRSNSRYQYTLGAAQLDSSLAKNTLVVLVDTHLAVSQHCVPAAKKADGFPGTC